MNVIALLDEQARRHRAIDAAAHRDDNFFLLSNHDFGRSMLRPTVSPFILSRRHSRRIEGRLFRTSDNPNSVKSYPRKRQSEALTTRIFQQLLDPIENFIFFRGFLFETALAGVKLVDSFLESLDIFRETIHRLGNDIG